MNFIGVDLHKKSITVCVMDEKRKVLARKTLACTQTDEIVEFFRQFRPFKVVVEATASYLWFVELVEPLAEKVVLANPKKLRGDCREHQEDRSPGRPGPDRIPGPGHDPRVLPAHAPAAAAPGLGPPPPVSPGPDYLGPQQDPPHPQQLQRRPQRPVLGQLRPGLLEGGPPQRRGSVCDQTALGRMAGPPGSAAGDYYPGNQDPHKSLQPIRSSNSRSRLPRDQRSTTESTEIHGKENPNQLPFPCPSRGATPARRVGSFHGYPFVMIFLAGVDDGSSDNWQEVGQDVDSGPDHNPVAGRPVPEKEGRARPNRTKSR